MRRVLSIISYMIGCLAILLLVLVLAYREKITQHTVDYLTTQVETHTGYQIKCGKIQLAFPMDIQIECVKVFSKEQPQLFIDNLEIRITPWGILRRHIVIDSVKIGTLSVMVAPDLSTPTELSWSLIPGSLKIENLLIERLHVDPEAMVALNLSDYASLVSQEAPMRIAGRWAMDPFERTLFADFSLSQSAQPSNQTHLIVSLAQPTEELDAHVRIAESDHGILADQFDMPHGYTFQGIIHAKGKAETWQQIALSEHAEKAAPPLLGDFQFSYSAKDKEGLPFIGAYGFVKGPFSISKSHEVSIARLEGLVGNVLLNGNIELTSDLHCDGTNLNLSIRDPIEIEQIKLQNINAFFQLSGSMFCPNIDFQSKSDKLQFQNMEFTQVDAHGKMQCTNEVLSGNLTVNCKHNEKDLQASSTITLNITRKLIGLSHLQFIAGATKLTGNLQFDVPQSLVDADLEGTSDLALFQELIGLPSQGILFLKARLYKITAREPENRQGQILDLSIRSNRISIDKFAAEDAGIALSIDNPFTNPSLTVSFNSRHVLWDKWEASDLAGETIMKPGNKQWPFSFTAKQSNLELVTKGSWYIEKDLLDFTFDILEGGLEDHAFALQEPVHFKMQKDFFEISPITLSIGQGRFYATVRSPSGYIQAMARIKDFPLDLLRIFHPDIPVKGNASGELFLIDSPEGVTGNTKFNISNAEILAEPYVTPNPWHASLNAELRNGKLEGRGHLVGIAPNPIELSATIPLRCSLRPFSCAIDPNQELTGNLLAQGNIESILELILPVTTTNLTGQTTLALNVSGTMKDPKINGQMDIVNGTFEILDIGASVKKVKAHFNINGRKLTMTELSAVGAESGTITGTGTAELDLDKDIPFDFSFQLDKLGMRPLNYTYVTGSGPLRMIGNTHGGTLSGKITSNSLQMRIPEKIPELAQAVQVKYINQPSHLQPPTIFVNKESKWPLTFNLELEVPREGMINGRDWTSEWKGNALLTGNTDHWEMHGTCKIIRGEYRFNGKSFEISQGTITFAGEPDKKTSLYVIASKDIETIHAEIILKGDINHPAITFRSNPPMSQREILSWILFNRGTSDITAFQGTQLNESITELNTGSRQPDMLTQIRERFGVDKIDITHDEHGTTNEVSLQVGKYISKGVLVSVQKSITAEANSLCIEADLIKHFKVQAEIDDEANGLMRLKWKKDY